jgi:hypothetical protein
MTTQDKIIEAKLKRIAKQIDPDNTFLNECEDVIKNRFSKSEKDKIIERELIFIDDTCSNCGHNKEYHKRKGCDLSKLNLKCNCKKYVKN